MKWQEIIHNTLWICAMIIILSSCKQIQVTDAMIVDQKPVTFPDYVGVTIPVNIAPMEFGLETDDYDLLHVRFEGSRRGELIATGKECVEIDAAAWKQLLADNQTDSLSVVVSACKNEKWIQYQPFTIYVRPEPIDFAIVYRQISPGYQTYSKMGIYQRTLSDFCEKPLFENTQVTNTCVNCHTFCKGNPNRQSIHFRGKNGATILMKDGVMTAYETRTDSTLASAVYPYWHPSGRYIAYSTNMVRQVFHVIGPDNIETFDLNSDIYVYDLENNEIIQNHTVKHDGFFETNPAFSADGRTLYFCRAQRRNVPKEVTEVRYDLCSVSFDPDKGELGNVVDTLLMLSDKRKSVALPRPTSDGKYVVYAETNYGSFPLYQKDADLWIMDLSTRKVRKMDELNSDSSDAFHNWSSNDRWMVFGSRRGDGMHALPYFAYVDEHGVGRKPFLLPQQHPKAYYRKLMMSYNCLEFVIDDVNFDARKAAGMLYSSKRTQVKIKK